MKLADIFGTHLRPMMEYVGWLKSTEGYNHIGKCDTIDHPIEAIDKAHTFLSQPMDLGYFVRGEEPKLDKSADSGYGDIPTPQDEETYNINMELWQNWKPLFKGEWEVTERGDLMHVWANAWRVLASKEKLSSFKTLNKFTTHCSDQGIELELNEEYEI